MCRPQSLRRSTMSRPRWPDSMNPASEVPGTIHQGDIQKSKVDTLGIPSASLHDVRRNRDCRSSKLALQSVSFRGRKPGGCRVNADGKSVCEVKSCQLAMISAHTDAGCNGHASTLEHGIQGPFSETRRHPVCMRCSICDLREESTLRKLRRGLQAPKPPSLQAPKPVFCYSSYTVDPTPAGAGFPR